MDSRVRLGTLIAPAFAGPHDALRRDAFDEYWLKGGRGSGKSTFIALELVLGLLRDPDSNAVVYRRVAATLRESVFEQLLWAIEALGLSERFRARVSPPEIERIDTGQRVLFRGADDPGKSKSIKLAKGYFRWLWFEELTEFDGPADLRQQPEHGPDLSEREAPDLFQGRRRRKIDVPRIERIVHRSALPDGGADECGPVHGRGQVQDEQYARPSRHSQNGLFRPPHCVPGGSRH